jgi:hypothetical protein
VEVVMKTTIPKRLTLAVLFLTAGFIGGSVLARTATIAFKKAGLFQVMQRIHKDAGTAIVWKDDVPGLKSFDLEAGAPETLIVSAAKRFDRAPVRVSSVTVLDPALPDAATGKERIAALDSYLTQTLPTDDASPDDYAYPFARQLRDNVTTLGSQLPGGTSSFSQLRADQQRALLEALRANQVNASLGTLRYVIR